MAVDMVTAEIVRNYLETVTEEISKTMERTAVSNVYNEAHDYSCGVFFHDETEASLLARAAAIPSHIFASVVSVQTIFDYFEGDLQDGDIVIVADPYFGGSHAPDWTVMKPVFHDDRPVFFPAVRAHMLDVGGPVSGGYNSMARDVWQEGFRIAPMKVYERGELREDVWNLLVANSRVPNITTGDFSALVGGCQIGRQRILELVQKYGMELLLDCVEYILSYSERLVRSEISKWPDGSYQATSIVDQDFAGTEDIPIRVTIDVETDGVTVDFSGSHEQVPGFINSTPGNSASHVYAQFAGVFPHVPVNSGFFRPIKCVFPEGTVVNPRSPAPVGNSTVCAGADIGQATMKAIEAIAPELVGFGEVDLTIVLTMGRDRRQPEEMFISFDYLASPTSASGAYGQDGWGTWTPLFCALYLTTVEMMEIQYPFIYYQAEYAPDTAAPGRWRGVPAFHMVRDHTDELIGDGKVNVLVQMSRHPIMGHAGGRDAVGNLVVLDQGGTSELRVDDWAFEHPIRPGQRIFAQSQGGGGWGDPFERDPAAVREDVLDEYVSIEGASREYGVVIDPATMEIDEMATRRARHEGGNEG